MTKNLSLFYCVIYFLSKVEYVHRIIFLFVEVAFMLHGRREQSIIAANVGQCGSVLTPDVLYIYICCCC